MQLVSKSLNLLVLDFVGVIQKDSSSKFIYQSDLSKCLKALAKAKNAYASLKDHEGRSPNSSSPPS